MIKEINLSLYPDDAPQTNDDSDIYDYQEYLSVDEDEFSDDSDLPDDYFPDIDY